MRKTGNNQPLKCPGRSSTFTQYKRFTDLNLFKYAFNVIQNWETDGFTVLLDGAYFLLAVMVGGDESSRLMMAH